jgi:Predicted membrane protein (DUF2142)
MPSMKRAEVLALVGLAVALLVAGWVLATRPYGAPDEASHYLRALSITNGTLLGPRVAYPLPLTAAAEAFVNHDTRAVQVPAQMSPDGVRCADRQPDLDGCAEATPTGDYFPLAYLLPATMLGISPDAETGLWLARAASALPCIALLVVALALLWDGTAWSLLGLFGALPPMVFFVCSILNPSGLETAACFAFIASVLRLSRTDRSPPKAWLWVAFAVSGATAILAWQAGPGFVLVDLVVGAALITGPKRFAIRAWGRRPFGISGLFLLVAMLAWLIYGRASGASHSPFDVFPFWDSLKQGLGQLGPVLHDAVGHFGQLSIALPSTAVWVWWLFELALVLGALWLGDRRERVIVTVVTLVALAFPVLSYAWIYRNSGFGMQGRQVLPALILIPLVSGEVIRRRAYRLRGPVPARVPAITIALIAGFQAYAWGFDASATSNHGAWTPPLGWLPWAVLIAIAVGALVLLAADQAIRPTKARAVVRA